MRIITQQRGSSHHCCGERTARQIAVSPPTRRPQPLCGHGDHRAARKAPTDQQTCRRGARRGTLRGSSVASIASKHRLKRSMAWTKMRAGGALRPKRRHRPQGPLRLCHRPKGPQRLGHRPQAQPKICRAEQQPRLCRSILAAGLRRGWWMDLFRATRGNEGNGAEAELFRRANGSQHGRRG